MMTKEIATAIVEAREARGMSASEVARAMKTTPSAVFNWERGKNRPASKNLLALAEVLKVDASRFLIGDVVLLENAGELVKHSTPPREVELASDAPPFEDLGGRRDVQVLGITVGGEDGDFSLNGEVVEMVPRPRGLVSRQVFALRVVGTSMEPRFDEGDLVYVERSREPAIGDDGVFEMLPSDEWQAGRAFVKQLVSKGGGNVNVRQFNPEKPITWRRDEIKKMYRIVPRNELHGV